ncbi:MAG TPA: hypothetical protein VFO79_10620 [Xanthomonadales bacterium]|nr:hypothetical protein [Xanthomonadales bacterium]
MHWLLAAALLVGCPASAAPPAPPVRSAQDIAQLLAPSTAADAREALFGRLNDSAERGDGTAAYVLGSLYRRGAGFPGLLLKPNPGRALMWLHAAARLGELNAFAKLAETYAATGEPLEAMAWAQAYLYFIERDPSCTKPCTDVYATVLLARLFEALPADAEARIRDRTRQLLVRIGPEFELARAQKAKAAGAAKSDFAGARHRVAAPTAENAPQAGLVEFVVQIGTDGRVRDAWLLDAVPQADVGLALEKSVRALKFEPARTERYAIVPLVFGG